MPYVILKIGFGRDQTPVIETILKQLKKDKHVIAFSKKDSPGIDPLLYTITFNNAYGCYIFGVTQGRMKPQDVIKILSESNGH